MSIGDNENKAKFFFSTDGKNWQPVGDIVPINGTTPINVETHCLDGTVHEFTASISVSKDDKERLDAFFWGQAEGLEIVPREDR